MEDFALAKKYGISSVPSLVINQEYMVSGVQPLSKLVDAIENIQKNLLAEEVTFSVGGYSLKDGKFLFVYKGRANQLNLIGSSFI